MIAFFLNMLIIMAAMWAIFRFMYPKPKQMHLAKPDDDVSIRHCDHCATPLATYRGILIPKSLPASSEEAQTLDYAFVRNDKHTITDDCWFFCNGEHQAQFCAAHPEHCQISAATEHPVANSTASPSP